MALRASYMCPSFHDHYLACIAIYQCYNSSMGCVGFDLVLDFLVWVLLALCVIYDPCHNTNTMLYAFHRTHMPSRGPAKHK